MHELPEVNKELSLEWGVNNIVEDCGWSCFVYSKKKYQNQQNKKEKEKAWFWIGTPLRPKCY